MLKYSNEQIFEGLINNDTDITKNIYYYCFKSVGALIRQYGGSTEEANDVFHDAFCIVYLKIIKNQLILTCPFKNYLTLICIRLWFKEYNRKSKHLNIDDMLFSDHCTELPKHDIESRKLKLFTYHFNRLSIKCQQLLRLYFYDIENSKISKKMGHNSTQHTANRKTRCQSSLRNRIFKDPEFLNIKNYE